MFTTEKTDFRIQLTWFPHPATGQNDDGTSHDTSQETLWGVSYRKDAFQNSTYSRYRRRCSPGYTVDSVAIDTGRYSNAYLGLLANYNVGSYVARDATAW